MTGISTDGFDSPFAITLPSAPYPGLRPFEKHEWPIFFGRERMADAVVADIVEKHLLVVHGDSGCGKSSLIRAAVLPRLEQENARGGIRWRTSATTPGESPLWTLARAFAPLVPGVGQDAVGREDAAFEIRRVMNFGREAPEALADLLHAGGDEHICLLLDQFEELFAHAAQYGSEEAKLVTDFCTALYAKPPAGLYAILTMRSEFLGACARFDDFAETVNATQYLLPRMRHDDLLRAIREPAMLYGGEVTRDLAERLIADAGGGQDQLPLIQHGLMLLYLENMKDVRPWRLGLEHYKAGRSLNGLLSDHADAVLAEVQKRYFAREDDPRVVEDLFRSLTDINAEGHAIRRPQTLAQLIAITGGDETGVRGAIDLFRAEGVSFLRPYGDVPIGPHTRIDISHEALIRCWQKIADAKDGWLIREFRNGLVWRALLVQAESFERDPANVLGPVTTDERQQWLRRRTAAWATRYGGGWERADALIQASAAARDRRRAEEAEARRREEETTLKEQRYRLVLRGSVLLVVLLAASLYFAWGENRARAESERARAESEMLTAKTEGAAKQLLDTLHRLQPDAPEERAASQPEAPVAQTAAVKQIEAIAYSLADNPRVFVHISDEGNRAAAQTFAGLLEKTTLNGAKILVPGIQLVAQAKTRPALRCFHRDDCAKEGPQLLSLINGMLSEPQLTLQDFAQQYEKTVRSRQYEVWFTAPIAVKDAPRSR